jgi:hypothetical protein
MIGDVSLFNLLIPVLIAVAVASRGFRVDDDYIVNWASWFNLGLTPENKSAVRRYLQLSRRCRTAGGLVGFLAPTIYFQVVTPGHQPDDVGGWVVMLMLVGYLLGALIAEVVIDPPWRRSENAVAVPVRLGDHLPTYAVVLQRGLGISSVLLVGLYALLEPDARISGLPDVAQVAGFGFAAVCIAVVIEACQRRIIARPRSVTGEVGVGTDNAIRASSLHVIAGGGIALLGNIAGPMFILSLVAVAAESGPTAWLAFVAFGIVFLASMYFWLYFGKPGGFGIRRREGQEVTT